MATLRVRRVRRKRTGLHRRHKPVWRDPYPWVKGTRPEKMLFAELIRRRIYFVYQDTLEEWMQGQFSTLAVPEFIPDFVCPEYRVIIDPFSDYHHTLEEAIERDVRKMASYNSMGYAFYHPWATELDRFGAAQVVNAMPNFFTGPTYPLSVRDQPFKTVPGYRLGPYVGLGATSVAAANRARKKMPDLTLKVRR